MKIFDGGQAFPVPETEFSGFHEGMSLRDYLAAKAMQSVSLALDRNEQELIANASYQMADAMLKARDK